MMTPQQIAAKVEIHWGGRLTAEQLIEVSNVWIYLRQNLTNISRQREQEESINWWYRHVMRGPVVHVEGHEVDLSEQLIDAAQSDPAAFEAAKRVIAEIVEGGGELTPTLAGFVVNLLRDDVGSPKAGKGVRGLTDLRNEHLAFSVWRLKRVGIPPTRKAESEDLSGCEIVADVFLYVLYDDAEGVVVKPKGGSFSDKTMYDIWVKDPRVKQQKKLLGLYLEL